MPKVRDLVTDIGDKAIQQALDEYKRVPAPLKKAHPMVLVYALKQVNGDYHRLSIDPADNSVIIHNNKVW